MIIGVFANFLGEFRGIYRTILHKKIVLNIHFGNRYFELHF